MSLIALSLAALVAATTDIWTEPSLVNVFPDSGPSEFAKRDIRIYGAAGERESFQICIEGGRKGYRIKEVNGAAPGEGFEPPEIRRVAYLQVSEASPRRYLKTTVFPDPLLPMMPFEVPAKETRALWVTYAIPPDARAGVYKSQIEIVPENGPKRRVGVELEVFGFALPEVPTLRTSFPLNRKAVRAVYGIPEDSLEGWKPVYDGLAFERIGFSLWTDGRLVTVHDDGSAATSTFQDHLAYAVEKAHMAAIDLGMGDQGVSEFPPPPEGEVQDPLQTYLFDMNGWLNERGWLERGFIQPMPPQEAEERQEARAEYFRVWRADKRTRRLVAGALHPSLERYTDIWAVPLRYYDPYAQRRLQAGYSLVAEPAYPAEAVEASSSGGRRTYAFTDTTAEEAYDGSLFTAWVSAEAPSEKQPEWLRVDLAEPAETGRMRIGWKPGLEPTEIEVRTSADGRVFNKATARWEHHSAAHSFDQSWSECRFRTDKLVQSILLEFTETAEGGPVGIAEIEFGEAPDPETVERIQPLEMWTYSLTGDFPGLYTDASPMEARIVPWVCWGHGAQGFLYRGLNDWPKAWASLRVDQPLVWTGGGDGYGYLFYPGPDGPQPSLRVERLRDGIEDYEYLVRMKSAVEEGLKADREVAPWLEPRSYSAETEPQALTSLGERLMRVRQLMGWALTQWTKEDKG